jgi:S-adenosylmethionine:diacylglycerol 3-amino-3-carboxypropyl transferase
LSAVKEPVEEAGHVVHAVRRVDRHERDDGGEQEHERAKSVDAEVILDAQRWRPTVQLNEADNSVGGQADPDD